MTLEEFLDMWSDPDRKAIICDEKDYMKMVDALDSLKTDPDNEYCLLGYTLLTIEPGLTDYKPTCFLQNEISQGEVTHYFMSQKSFIIWIVPETDEI